ncbi:hypothetical protein [Rothia endophytica]|uniref:hypothetical protein n=1 Tax=Rothia endophytica TaxID=1324766 RepID=UPI001F33161C|nr:hypothetical protein [Rothia endophytica]
MPTFDRGIAPLAHALATDFEFAFEYDAPESIAGVMVETAELDKTYVELTGRIFTIIMNIAHIGDERAYSFTLYESEDDPQATEEDVAEETVVLQEAGIATLEELEQRVRDVLTDSANYLTENETYDIAEVVRVVDETYSPEQQAQMIVQAHERSEVSPEQDARGSSFFK